MVRIILLLIFSLCVYVTKAQEVSTPMSLHDCMEYAVSHSTKVRIQEADIDDARLARRTALLTLLTPRVGASVGLDSNFGRNIDPTTNAVTYLSSTNNNYGISAGIDLFDGFNAVNNYKISRTSLQIAGSQEKQVEAEICLAVMEAYYNVVYYKRLLDVYEEQVRVAEQSLAKARRQEELGQKGHADVVQMAADLADREYECINAANTYASQKMTLEDLMFWPMDQELQVVMDLDADAAPTQLGENVTSVVEHALAFHPSVQIAAWRVDNARRELSTAKWRLLPSIGLTFGWGTNYIPGGDPKEVAADPQLAFFGPQFNKHMGEYVQLSVSIPIWDRLNRRATISKQRNAYSKASAELDQKRRDVESEVRRAVQDRDGSAAAWLQAQRKADVQSEAYHLNLKKLEQGLISPLEFQTANNNYLRACADEMASQFKYRIKQAVVRYYNGVEYVDQR